jgi:polysaccharide biosynthesis/export protein
MTRKILLLLTALCLASCSGPYMGKDLFGADEFVLDSYKIREGKFSILEMEGHPVAELDEECLDEYQDKIHEDDVLHIAIYHPKRVDIVQSVQNIGATIGYRVANGQINLPDLPPVRVAGLTLDEARQKIMEDYQQHIQDMEVFITYRQRIARKVELAGLVAVTSLPVDG